MNNEKKQPNKPLALSDVTVFRNSPHLAYLYKKTEKLVSALYMLSSLISDKEPVKWQMRGAGVDLLSHSLSLSDRSSSERIFVYNNFLSTALKFLSFLEVSYAGGVISEMNYLILRAEFESLIQLAESSEKWGDAKSLIFPPNFFTVSEVAPLASVPTPAPVVYKGQNTLSDRLSVRHTPAKQREKGGRQEVILDLLKKNQELGIKDFVSSISGCSEKTIQRELASLVLRGLIKKQGEKRWSRYSLK